MTSSATSSASLITRSNDFDPTLVSYKEPRLNKRGGKNVSLLTRAGGSQLIIQFPFIFTWGVNERVDETSGRVSYDLNLSFQNTDESDPTGQLFHKLKALQEKFLDDAVENSKLWFGKAKMSREVAEAMMYPILKYPKIKEGKGVGEPDLSRPATIKLKLQYWDEKFNVELYNMNKDQIFGPNTETDKTPMELVPSRSHIKGLMRCTGAWFAGGRFGLTWDLVQAQVRPPVMLQGFCILDDSDDETTLAKLDAQDKEEEDAMKDTPTTPPASPTKKKKRVVRKKKN